MDHGIREIVNRDDIEFYRKYFKSHQDKWNTLCAAMDTIGDATLAIQDFQTDGVGSRQGEKYLRLYGLFQAIFLQQDAIRELFLIIKHSFDAQHFLKDLEDYSLEGWKTIRRYRNLSVGHPIKNESYEKGKIKRVMISRVTISSKGFQLLISDPASPSLVFQHVDLDELLSMYLSEAKTVLGDLEAFLKNYKF